MSEATKDTRAEALVASYERAGYARVAPPILQPAEPFLDLSGEDIRRRMYLVSDASGGELCLRPDLTIPVALDYLASADAGRPAKFCYLGPIFRQRDDGPAEFLQVGIETFGRGDTAAADAETLALAVEATSLYGLAKPTIRMGDLSLFSTFIGALDLAPAWRRRLAKDFNRKTNFAHDLDRLVLARPKGAPEYQGVLAALANSDPKGAHALVTDLLSIAGITAVGGRSVGEIADRFLEQSALGAGSALPGETRKLIERFLAISGDPDEALVELRALAADARLDLGLALDLFESRAGFLATHGLDLNAIAFSTAYGRGLDYYTGMVFELHDPSGTVKGELVAGGRYDGLFARLGSPSPVPAVGFAVWLDGLVTLTGRPGGRP